MPSFWNSEALSVGQHEKIAKSASKHSAFAWSERMQGAKCKTNVRIRQSRKRDGCDVRAPSTHLSEIDLQWLLVLQWRPAPRASRRPTVCSCSVREKTTTRRRGEASQRAMGIQKSVARTCAVLVVRLPRNAGKRMSVSQASISGTNAGLGWQSQETAAVRRSSRLARCWSR